MKPFDAAALDGSMLKGKRVAVLGYGNQGRAQALCLRESGLDVVIGGRPEGASREIAEGEGFPTASPGEAVRGAEIVAFLLPDEEQGRLFTEEIAPNLEPGQALLFAHGFSVHFRQVRPDPSVDVIMVSPKGPGALLRQEFLAGGGLVMFVAVHRDASGRALSRALSYAAALGGSRSAVFETSFASECEADLFGEQTVLCGGLSHLILAAFETLVEAGFPEELAYFECLHEVKLVADLIHERGITGMRRAISPTAAFGDLTRGPRIINESVKAEMRRVLEEIRGGEFAREWILENQAGRPVFSARLAAERAHPIEEVTSRLRDVIGRSRKSGSPDLVP